MQAKKYIVITSCGSLSLQYNGVKKSNCDSLSYNSDFFSEKVRILRIKLRIAKKVMNMSFLTQNSNFFSYFSSCNSVFPRPWNKKIN